MKFSEDFVSTGNIRYNFVYIVLLWIFFVSLLTACPAGFYGSDCNRTCSLRCLSHLCDNMTGACSHGCRHGYQGDLCESECQQGFYGANCSSECPSNCVNDTCDHTTGQCIQGCLPGDQGIACEEKLCPDGFYGSNCSSACPAHCHNTSCDSLTGHCRGSCKAGYKGNHCEEECSAGSHGPGCQTPCPATCASPICHHVTGACSEGCKPDFWGSDCSLTGDLKSNPEPQQAKFYQKLSAEGRSVLLYMLMGEYERTLERAQLEISRSLRQRNEIRELINGDL
uniref:Egf1 n=1 Tax=Onchidium reevesii TaxID=2547651 RepID=A0A3S6GZ87_9EUPU|nr:egf1 [Onchidium reevesii]